MKNLFKKIVLGVICAIALPAGAFAAPLNDLPTCLASGATTCTLDTSGGDVSLTSNLTIPVGKTVNVIGGNDILLQANTLTVNGKLYLGDSLFVATDSSTLVFGGSSDALIASGTAGSCLGIYATSITAGSCTDDLFVLSGDNYSGSNISVQGDDVVVNGADLIIKDDFTIPNDGSVTINDGQYLIVPEGVVVTNNGDVNNVIITRGSFVNHGDVSNVVINNAGSFTNDADISLTQLLVSSDSTVTNTGNITFSSRYEADLRGSIVNNGSITFTDAGDEEFLVLYYPEKITGNDMIINMTNRQDFSNRTLYNGTVLDGDSQYYVKNGLLLYKDVEDVYVYEALYNNTLKEYNVLIEIPNDSSAYLETLYNEDTDGLAIGYELLEADNIEFYNMASLGSNIVIITNSSVDGYDVGNGDIVYSQYMDYDIIDSTKPAYYKYKMVGAADEEIIVNVVVLADDIPAVMFESNGGTYVKSLFVDDEGKVVEPSAPTKDGYTFDGWYSDSALTTKFDFNTAVDELTILYAKWNEVVENALEVDNPQTGDNIMFLSLLGILSLGSFLGAGLKIRRNKIN
ncbi:MAG: InlB B-repeat-containing protein [bacterium]|nr:InlB B-repeat-containing protein [bacterium]